MVNVRSIANRFTSTINPNLTANLYVYTGYSVNAAGKTVPTWAAPVPIAFQIQSLLMKEIEHLDSMNLSSATRAAYVNRQLSAIDRATQDGGDVLVFENAPWQVTAVLEGWTAAGWCKVALTKQMPRAGQFGF